VRKITVLLADGHEAYRQGLARAVTAHPRLELAEQVSDGRRALECVLALEPDVAVLEVRMPHLDGLEVCDVLGGLERRPGTRIVLLSSEANETLAAAARVVGVAAVLSKDLARQELCERLVQLAAQGSDQP
jgi:DNA-binding NarL/FixJ family response regulator